jgi:hypothetical protein
MKYIEEKSLTFMSGSPQKYSSYIYFFRYVKEKMTMFDDVIAYETNSIYIDFLHQ